MGDGEDAPSRGATRRGLPQISRRSRRLQGETKPPAIAALGASQSPPASDEVQGCAFCMARHFCGKVNAAGPP